MKNPRNEKTWVRVLNIAGQEKYLVTSNEVRTIYYLYENVSGEWKRIAKSKSPIAFEDTIKIADYLGGESNTEVLRKRKKRAASGSKAP